MCIAVLVETNFGASRTLYLKAFRSLKNGLDYPKNLLRLFFRNNLTRLKITLKGYF